MKIKIAIPASLGILAICNRLEYGNGLLNIPETVGKLNGTQNKSPKCKFSSMRCVFGGQSTQMYTHMHNQ